MIDSNFVAELNSKSFLRDHVAFISYRALQQNMKGQQTSLANKLVDDGAFSEADAISMGVMGGTVTNIFANGTPQSRLTENGMRWNYAFPGIYTTKEMIANMKNGNIWNLL